jgi:hypothetical protein
MFKYNKIAQKMKLKKKSTFYMSTISSHSNEPSNSSNSSSKPNFLELTLLNWKVVYIHLKDHLANFCSQKSNFLSFLIINNIS